jgi:transcriptional regulator with XRE-family HTH domain
MTDAPTTREEAFFALVYPALVERGYTAYRGQQRLVADTGMNKSTASRLINREGLPHVQFFAPLAKVLRLDLLDLLEAAEILPPGYRQSQQTLSETKQSQVGSGSITPEEAADRLGFDGLDRFMFLAMVDKLKNPQADDEDANPGGTAAQM